MATKRKPLAFDVDRSPPTPVETVARSPVQPQAVERQQVGARVPVSIYRQLKARAALEGVRVQDLVEAAITQYLAAKPQS
jgi:predicted HicB family RNase H-like nuclease